MTGRLREVGARASRTRQRGERQLERLRSDYELVDAALEAGDLDRRRAGSVLAGGIAFRVFLWLLPAALLIAGAVGLVRPSGSAQPDHVARTLGLGASVAAIVRQATRDSERGTAALLALGIGLTLYMSLSLLRALRVAHVLAWEEPMRRRSHVLRDGALLSVALLTMLGVETGVAYLRHRVGVGLSLPLALVPIVIGGAVWVAVSMLLPHADAHWTALIPRRRFVRGRPRGAPLRHGLLLRTQIDARAGAVRIARDRRDAALVAVLRLAHRGRLRVSQRDALESRAGSTFTGRHPIGMMLPAPRSVKLGGRSENGAYVTTDGGKHGRD